MEVESTSTVHNSSPGVSRHLQSKQNRNVLQLPDTGSVHTAFSSQTINPIEQPPTNRRGLRPRRVLSSIASSSDEHHKSQNAVDSRVRECRSLDALPLITRKQKEMFNAILRRSAKSLENCDGCGGNIQIIAVPEKCDSQSLFYQFKLTLAIVFQVREQQLSQRNPDEFAAR